jgi:hypothetical protein
MELIVWLPVTFLLGLLVMGVCFLFELGCDNI